MPMYIIAKASSKSEVERRNMAGLPSQAFLEALAINYADGNVNDIKYYVATSEEEVRIIRGDEYSLIWVADELTGIDFVIEETKKWLRFESSAVGMKANAPADLQNDNITIWTAATYLQGDVVFNGNSIWQCTVTSTTSEPSNNNSDWSRICSGAKIKVQVLNADKESIAVGQNGPAVIRCKKSDQSEAYIRVIFVEGEAEFVLVFSSLQDTGTWSFPYSDVREIVNNFDIRIDQQANIEVLLPF